MSTLSISSFLILPTLILQCLFVFPTQARWATYEDAPAEIEFYNSDIVVDKEGKTEEFIEKQIKILKESGRNLFGVERIQFNENIEKFDIIEAKTIIDGKEYIVPKEMIEIKPLASEINGFDQLFQILISYPHVGVGSKVYLKIKSTVKKQPLPKYFALKYYYGGGAYWKKAKYSIKSELPLKLLKNDPNDNLEIKEDKDGKYQTIVATSKKPIYGDLSNESLSNQVPDNLRTWVSLSTVDSFEDLSKALAKDYEEVIRQDLPPLQESIRKEAAKATNSIDQINTVTSLLAEKIRYMGDWRTIEGKISPRPFKTVATSGVGDCKDFSASTAAILNALGYKAKTAIVFRGIAYLPPEKALPSLSNFNHAIVKVVDKEGKVFWIDPTNFTSMADGIYPDISDRPVLVLDSKDPSYEHIPIIDANHSKVTFNDTIEIKDGNGISNVGSMEFSGEQAIDDTGAGLSYSLQSIEEAIIKQLTGEASPVKKKVTFPPLDSRIVKDFKIDYYFEQENNLLLTNEGPGLLLRTGWSQPFLDTSTCQIGTTFVGLPATILKRAIIKDVDAKQAQALAYEFKSPWLEAKRECQVVNNGVEIKEKISILKSFITAEDASSKQYKDLRDMLKKYFNKTAIIISKSDNKKSNTSPLARGG